MRLAASLILYSQDTKMISKERQRYESDKTLVTVIAKHYDILKILKYHEDDEKRIDYSWNPSGKSKTDRKQKYVATAMEACLGAFFLDHE